MQSEKQDPNPSSMKSTYKQIFEVVRLPAVMRLGLLLMLCKVGLFHCYVIFQSHTFPHFTHFLSDLIALRRTGRSE